jgi:CspA family cold shock protein
MPTGLVQNFKPGQRFGFITPSGGGKNIFFHVSGVVGTVRENDEVEYREAPDRKNPEQSCAVDVRPLEAA